jgi:selenocysteine-specific elongation factor
LKHIVIGTAGHIDHGKTALVKALTGRDTDTLKEEKERGISIDLGFTYFDLPSGRRAGIIDVPGHEKFIKNMLAGAGGMDAVLLVIAADEGVMPQTREHLNILRLLQIKKGVIALTKKDMAEADWLGIVREQVREEVKGTFLEDAPILSVSSATGEGLGALTAALDRLTEDTGQRDRTSSFRLPVDRIFTVQGFGTVVTGTLIEGRICEGEKVMVFPSGLESRVRSIQVHEQGVKEAEAGQRVALNLAGIKVEQVQRGNVLAMPGSMEPTMLLDARVELLPDAPKGINNRSRLRLYHGTAEVMCRVVLLDRDQLKPGENALVQLRLEERLACRKGDRFVIRFYSPMLTIGGGNVLEPNPPKRRRFRCEVLEELAVKEKGSAEEILEQLLHKGALIYEKKQLLKQLGEPEEQVLLPILEHLKEQGRIMEFRQGEGVCYAHIKVLNAMGEQLCKLLEEFHGKNPLRPGMGKEEVKSKLFDDLRPRLYDSLLMYFEDVGLIKLTRQYIAAAAFEISYTEDQQKIRQWLIERYRQGKFNPPKLSELQGEGRFDRTQMNRVFNALVDAGSIVRLDEDIAFHAPAYEEGAQRLKDFIKEKGSIQLGQYRDLLGTSRKYAMALLDSFDQKKLTKRVEDKRILY